VWGVRWHHKECQSKGSRTAGVSVTNTTLFKFAVYQEEDVSLMVEQQTGRLLIPCSRGRHTHHALWSQSGLSTSVITCSMQTWRGKSWEIWSHAWHQMNRGQTHGGGGGGKVETIKIKKK